MGAYGGGEPDLVVTRGRPSGLALGVLLGGVAGVVLLARTSVLAAVVCLLVVVAVALVVPALIGRQRTELHGDMVRSQGVRGTRSVDLARLSAVRYATGFRGPARLQLSDLDGGRVSIPLPSTGSTRDELLARVSRAALEQGLRLDARTRRGLGTATRM